jgi:hypothetical protein
MTMIAKIPLRLGRPQVAGPLAVFPLLGGEPLTEYRGLAHALRLGASVTEVDGQGSMGEVLICNPTDEALLVYEGEEIQGAKQNRIFDAHTLVPAGAELKLAVSCVEQGRWGAQQQPDRFVTAPHVADPALRRAKRVRTNRASIEGATPGADQGEVWREVSSRLAVHGVRSGSDALADLYRTTQPELDKLCRPIRHEPGQLGAVVEISGRPMALDLIGRPEVFAELLPRLANGYALHALSAASGEPNERAAREFLEAVLEAPRRGLPTGGLGEGFLISEAGIEGAGLINGGELIALSGFPATMAR